MPDKEERVRARIYMLDQATDEQFRVGCATPGPGCQEYPLFAPTLDEARILAKTHAEDCGHVLSIKWVRTTSIEVWATDDLTAPARVPSSEGGAHGG